MHFPFMTIALFANARLRFQWVFAILLDPTSMRYLCKDSMQRSDIHNPNETCSIFKKGPSFVHHILSKIEACLAVPNLENGL